MNRIARPTNVRRVRLTLRCKVALLYRVTVGHYVWGLRTDEGAAVMVEYALVLSLLAFVMLGGMYALGLATSSAFTNFSHELQNYGLRNNQ